MFSRGFLLIFVLALGAEVAVSESPDLIFTHARDPYLSFRYPEFAGWKTNVQPDFLEIIPPSELKKTKLRVSFSSRRMVKMSEAGWQTFKKAARQNPFGIYLEASHTKAEGDFFRCGGPSGWFEIYLTDAKGAEGKKLSQAIFSTLKLLDRAQSVEETN